MISVGFFYSKSMNFKGRFKMSNGWTKIRRKRNSMDVAFEMLFAPTINVDKTPTLINQKGDASLVSRFEIYEVRYKRMGWRVQVHMHRGIISTFFELGGRPGVYFNLNDVKPEDNKWYAKIYDGFYMRFGMGIGIGFINLN